MTNASENSLFARFAGNPPASRGEIEETQEKINFRFPASYVEFMLARNGGEGFIGRSYLVLWKIEDLIAINGSYQVAEFAPGIFLFGSSGGGEAFGFDIRSDACGIVSIPFVAMEIEDAKIVAPNFEVFLSTLFAS